MLLPIIRSEEIYYKRGHMLFNSFSYALFLPIVVVLFFNTKFKYRWLLTLCASYFFYMCWDVKLIWVILFTTITSYTSALLIEKAKSKKVKKIFLIIGVSLSLSCLIFFKYFNFLFESLTYIIPSGLVPTNYKPLNIILPVGISFYTFQTLSYVIDVYNKKMEAQKHFGIYALYVSFFPQLVAGPIERATELLPQFYKETKFDTARCTAGLQLVLIGLFKKVVIADTLAGYVNAVYNNIDGLGGLTIIIPTFLFSIQIYCDFSGYSTIAKGSAKILGYELMENFNSPYFSKSIKEFWRRWHISLSTWFSDYIYIPLGGSRVNKSRHFFNLIVTFFLSGLWHGANYTFILWGLFFGVVLCLETFYMPPIKKIQENSSSSFIKKVIGAGCWVYTFILVNIGWVLFRANSLSDAIYIFKNIFRGINVFKIFEYANSAGISNTMFVVIIILIALLFIYDYLNYNQYPIIHNFNKIKPIYRLVTYFFISLTILIVIYLRGMDNIADFIYFQF